LDQNIQHVALLIHRPPEIMTLTTNGEENLIEMPLVAWSRTPAPELIGIGLAEFPTPLADCLIGDDNAACKQQFFDISITEAEPVIEPDAVADNFNGKAVVFVALREHAFLPSLFAHMIGTGDSAPAEIMPYRATVG
jgi:hypothetical protein